MSKKDKTFKYELYRLSQMCSGSNFFAGIIFNVLKLDKTMVLIRYHEDEFYQALMEEDYGLAEFCINFMIQKGIEENSPRIVGMNTTLVFEKMSEDWN